MIVVYFGSPSGDESGDFPRAHVEVVDSALRRMITSLRPRLVVGGAAPGADLLALTVAASQQIERVVVVPGPADAFFATSVEPAGARWVRKYGTGLAGVTPDRGAPR